MTFTLLLCGFLGYANATIAKTSELEDFKREIRKLYDLKEMAFAKNDADMLVKEFYADDARSVSGNDAHTYAGRDEFLKVYKEIVPTATVKIESIETYVNGNAGWDWANFHVNPNGEDQKPFTFMILFLWTKENGQWISKGDFYSLGNFQHQNK